MANVRDSYTIRTSLGEGMWDLVINPSSPSSVIQFKRQFTVKTMVLALSDFIFFLYLLFETPFSSGGWIGMPLFFSGFLWLSYLLIQPTNTKLMGYNYLRPILNYIEHDYRHVSTRTAMPAAPFAGIAEIKGVTKDGFLVFNNDDVGEVIELIGNASILMFDTDQKQVINNVGNFYRNVRPQVYLTYDNSSAPQRVVTQLKAKRQQLDRLVAAHDSKNLQALVNMQRNVLANYVGKSFKALHQYVIVRATNRDELQAFGEWMQLQTGHQDADNYLREYRRMESPKEIKAYLKDIFSDEDLKHETVTFG